MAQDIVWLNRSCKFKTSAGKCWPSVHRWLQTSGHVHAMTPQGLQKRRRRHADKSCCGKRPMTPISHDTNKRVHCLPRLLPLRSSSGAQDHSKSSKCSRHCVKASLLFHTALNFHCAPYIYVSSLLPLL